MGKSLVEMAAEIVQSQCCTNRMSSDEISDSLIQTYKTLSRLSAGFTEEAAAATGKSRESGALYGVSETVAEKPRPEKKASGRKKEISKTAKTSAPVSPEESIQQDQIICLECGKPYKILSSKHLKTHGLSSREYREKYGFPLRKPLCSRALSEKRKKAGEERGAPENLLKAIADRKKNGQARKQTGRT